MRLKTASHSTLRLHEISAELVESFRGKKFLFVLGQYASMGGAERQAILLAQQLKSCLDCEIEFLSWQSEGRVRNELRDLDIPAHYFNLNWNRGAVHRVLTLRRLARFIRTEISPDHLLPYIGFNCKVMGLIWRKCGAKFTWWNQRDEGREIYGSRIEHRVIQSVPAVVSNSWEGRDFLAKTFGLPPDGIDVINNGIELPQHSDGSGWRSKLGLNADDRLLTMVANLTRYKDHDTLLRAFAKLRDTDLGKRCHLALAGRLDETTDALKISAFDLGLCQSVHFLGQVHPVTELWAATDLAVHSSKTEGCPNAALEAMSHGLAVCGTDISGMRQALGQAQAKEVLAPAKDADALCHILKRLVENNEDRGRRGELNRRRIAEQFSPEQLAKRVLHVVKNRQIAV